mmetsp:Transcript_65458/g.107655  ORF Transcript_65458/g.107655 Transcript_65458/m.107655 type:complete len:203 (-) Transcript_65458:4-612(-)
MATALLSSVLGSESSTSKYVSGSCSSSSRILMHKIFCSSSSSNSSFPWTAMKSFPSLAEISFVLYMTAPLPRLAVVSPSRVMTSSSVSQLSKQEYSVCSNSNVMFVFAGPSSGESLIGTTLESADFLLPPPKSFSVAAIRRAALEGSSTAPNSSRIKATTLSSGIPVPCFFRIRIRMVAISCSVAASNRTFCACAFCFLQVK